MKVEIKKRKAPYFIAIIIFIVILSGSFLLKVGIQGTEDEFLLSTLQQESESMGNIIVESVINRVRALNRMADRWSYREGVPFREWKRDAENYIKHQKGLRVVEWVDETYHVRWVEPVKGNEKAVGLNIVFNEKRRKALDGAAASKLPTVTPILDLVQGYKAFITYSPIRVRGEFKGFIVGIFDIKVLLDDALGNKHKGDFSVRLVESGKLAHEMIPLPERYNPKFTGKHTIEIYNRSWELEVIPLPDFLVHADSHFPGVVFWRGGLFGLVISLMYLVAYKSRRKSQQLQESEAKGTAIFQGAADGIFLVEIGGVIERCNPSGARMFGFEGEEIEGMNITAVFSDKGRELYYDAVEKLNRERLTHFHIKEDLLAVRRGGEEFPIELVLSRIVMEQRELYCCIARDVTERSKMEKVKNELVSTINHELRTPLTSITSAMVMLKDLHSDHLNGEGNSLVNLALRNAKRLGVLVDDFLDLEKIIAGKMDFNIKRCEISSLVRNVIEQNEPYASRYGVKFRYEESGDDVYCDVDRHRFNQALTNLLSNATKFSPKGGDVLITLEKEGEDYIRISVQDRGPGIPESFRKMVFDKFSQYEGATAKHQGGTGLGLSITKSLIERFGGSVDFSSEEGKGAIFYFVLPISKMEAEVS